MPSHCPFQEPARSPVRMDPSCVVPQLATTEPIISFSIAIYLNPLVGDTKIGAARVRDVRIAAPKSAIASSSMSATFLLLYEVR